MTRNACSSMVALMLISLAAPVLGQQYYLYSPKAIGAEEKVRPQDGVLVQEIPIQKGDTLSGISRKFSGKSHYYPQILLFNDIKNPNLIYTGDNLKVPVGKQEHQQRETGAVQRRKKGKHRSGKSHGKAPAAAAAKKTAAAPQPSGQSGTELSPSDLLPVDSGRKAKRTAREQRTPRVPEAKPAIKAQPRTETVPSRNAAIKAPRQEQQSAPVAEPTAASKLFEQAVKAYRQDDCRTAIELFDRFLVDNASSPLAADASLFKADCYLKQSNQ